MPSKALAASLDPPQDAHQDPMIAQRPLSWKFDGLSLFLSGKSMLTWQCSTGQEGDLSDETLNYSSVCLFNGHIQSHAPNCFLNHFQWNGSLGWCLYDLSICCFFWHSASTNCRALSEVIKGRKTRHKHNVQKNRSLSLREKGSFRVGFIGTSAEPGTSVERPNPRKCQRRMWDEIIL